MWLKSIKGYLMILRNTKFLGLSATFQRLGGKYHSHWDSFVAEISGFDLQKRGFIPPLRILAPPPKYNIDRVKITGGEYNSKELTKEMDKRAVYSDFNKYFSMYGINQPSICFCPTIEYATIINSKIQDLGFKNSLLYHSQLSTEKIKSVLNRLHELNDKGEPFCLVSVDKVSKGFDMPKIKTAFMLRPTKSIVKYRQQAGRLTRGTDEVLLVDMTCNSLEHGHPYFLIPPEVEHIEKKVKPEYLKCIHCYMLYPRKMEFCPFCYKTNSREGESSRDIVHKKDVDLVQIDFRQAEIDAEREKIKKHYNHSHNIKDNFLRKKGIFVDEKWVVSNTYKKVGDKIINKDKLIEYAKQNNSSSKSDN